MNNDCFVRSRHRLYSILQITNYTDIVLPLSQWSLCKNTWNYECPKRCYVLLSTVLFIRYTNYCCYNDDTIWKWLITDWENRCWELLYSICVDLLFFKTSVTDVELLFLDQQMLSSQIFKIKQQNFSSTVDSLCNRCSQFLCICHLQLYLIINICLF